MRLGLLFCLVAALADAQSKPYRSRELRGRFGREGPSSGVAASFTLDTEFSFQAARTMPVCTGDSSCKAICYVASACTWTCYDNTGASTGTVTNGASQACNDSFSGFRVVDNITGLTSAPRAALPAINGLWAGDFTVVFSGYANDTGDIEAFFQSQHLTDPGGALVGLVMRNEGGGFKCIFYEGASTFSPLTSQELVNGWTIGGARRTAAVRECRANGGWSTPVSTALGTVGAGDNRTTYFGTDDTALPITGPLAWFAFYDESKDDAWFATTEKAWWGVPDALTYTAGSDCLDNTADSGQVDCFSVAPLVGGQGLRTVRQTQNFWGASPLNVQASTAVGTPTPGNTTSGPFTRWRASEKCEIVTDDDGAAFEGWITDGGIPIQADAGVALDFYTASHFLLMGDAGTTNTKARIALTTDGLFLDGGTEVDCDIATLSNVIARHECTAKLVGGTPTFVKSQILVGNATTDTGSIYVCQSQLNANAWAENPAFDNGNHGNSKQWLSLAAVGDVTTAAKIEVVFVPVHDPDTEWLDVYDNVRLFDMTPTAGGHLAYIINGYVQAGDSQSLTSNGITDAQLNTAAGTIGLTPGQRYAQSLEWRGSGESCSVVMRLDSCAGVTTANCHATTSRGTVAGRCPTQPDRLWLMERYSETFQTSANIEAVRVYR